MVTVEYTSLSSADLELPAQWKLCILKTIAFRLPSCSLLFIFMVIFKVNAALPRILPYVGDVPLGSSSGERRLSCVPQWWPQWAALCAALPPTLPHHTHSHGPARLLFLTDDLLGQGEQRVCLVWFSWGWWLGVESRAYHRGGGKRNLRGIKQNNMQQQLLKRRKWSDGGMEESPGVLSSEKSIL